MASLGLLASGFVLQPAQVHAQDVQQGTGFYATLGLGASGLSNQSTDYLDGEYTYGGGFSGDIGAGYDFGPIRTELTYSYNTYPSEGLSTAAGTLRNQGGAVSLNSVYVSAYWDIPVSARLVPYIGGGLGYTNYSFASGVLDGSAYAGANIGTLGYQAKAGLSYVMSRQADLFLEGVYQGGASFNLSGERYGALNSWGGRLGLRWRFGGAPAQASAPASAEPEPTPIPTPEAAPAPVPEPTPSPVRGLW